MKEEGEGVVLSVTKEGIPVVISSEWLENCSNKLIDCVNY